MVKVFNSLTVIVSCSLIMFILEKIFPLIFVLVGVLYAYTVLYYIDNQILIQHDNHFMKNFKYKLMAWWFK